MGIEEFLLDSAKKEGMREGMEKGREESLRDTAFKMRNSGLEINLISNITGLSEEEIKSCLKYSLLRLK